MIAESKSKEYYIESYNKLYEECLSETTGHSMVGADILFGERATVDAIVGYYLANYKEGALETWLKQLNLCIGWHKEQETKTDKEVTRILMELFSDKT